MFWPGLKSASIVKSDMGGGEGNHIPYTCRKTSYVLRLQYLIFCSTTVKKGNL